MEPNILIFADKTSEQEFRASIQWFMTVMAEKGRGPQDDEISEYINQTKRIE